LIRLASLFVFEFHQGCLHCFFVPPHSKQLLYHIPPLDVGYVMHDEMQVVWYVPGQTQKEEYHKDLKAYPREIIGTFFLT
jgi:hypothetical protein